jgi:hypothetical protein
MSSKHKLEYRWMGPCKVWYASPEYGTYRLMEIDGTVLKGIFPGRRARLRRGTYIVGQPQALRPFLNAPPGGKFP